MNFFHKLTLILSYSVPKFVKISSIVHGGTSACFPYYGTIVRTLKEDQPLRLLLNLLFYHFNHSEATINPEA